MGASIPIVMSASGQAESTTQSAISGAQIVITDEARQKELTGQSSEETIASLNRNPVHSNQALETIFNQTEIEAGFEIVGALVRETNVFITHRAREADHKTQLAKNTEAQANDELIPVEQRQVLREAAAELRSQAQALNKQWGPGGTYRQVLTALTAAASGNVTGTTAQFVQAAAVNYLQSLGAEKIKKIADNLSSESVRAGLHGMLAYGSAAVQGQEGGSAALGASASVLVSNLLGSVDGLSAQEKEARKNLVTGLVAGIAAASGADATLAQNAAQIEVENNQLALPPPSPMVSPIAPLQPFRIPGRERHEGEEMPLFGGAPDRSRDRARPLVSPREVQQGVEPIITPMNEEVSEYGNAIFKEGAKKADKDKDYVPNAGSVDNMEEFFTQTEFGARVGRVARKTNEMYDGQSVYKATDKIGHEIKNGDLFYLDGDHKNHLEVYSGNRVSRHVLNLDGTVNLTKTRKARNRKLNK